MGLVLGCGGASPAPPAGSPGASPATGAGAANPTRRAEKAASQDAPATTGRWRRVDAERAKALATLGYVEAGRSPQGEAGGALAGHVLVTSGHAPGAWLMDGLGRTLHTWEASWEAAFPGVPRPEADTAAATSWRRAALLPDGSVVGVFEGLGRVRVGADGRVIWAVRDGAHHDVDVDGDAAWVLTRRVTTLPGLEGPVLEDAVERVDLVTGASRSRCSLVDAIHAGGGAPVTLSDRPDMPGDLLHSNAVERVQRPWPGADAVRPGHLLVSLLARSEVAVVDPTACRVVWSATGPWRHQHDPHLLDDGTLVLFDNEAGPTQSRVVRWRPGEAAPSWTWDRAGDVGLWSATCGLVEPLGDGWLVTESDGGRAFWVGPGGDVRWRWVTPHRAGRGGRLVATLFQVSPAGAWSP